MKIFNITQFKFKQKLIVQIMIISLIFNYGFTLSVSAQEDVVVTLETTIVSGDASSGVVASNDINQNNTDIFVPDQADADVDSSDDTDDVDGDVLLIKDEAVDGILVENNNESGLDNTVVGESQTGDNLIPETEGEAYIETGDASSFGVADNNVNVNNTEADCVDCDDVATTSVTVNNDNLATTTNDLNLSGATGENKIGTTSGDAIIVTGDVSVVSIIVNFINKNIFGRGTEFFINVWNNLVSSIDLSGFGNDSISSNLSGGVCEVNECLITINNVNTGEIVNDVAIKADTGNNLITSSDAQGIIETGDINVVNDVLNIANLNISGNDWFFAVVNIFGELTGDVILPVYQDGISTGSSESIIESESENQGKTVEAVITNTNNASVINSIELMADTGTNQAGSSTDQIESTVAGLVSTGNANIQSKTFNMINYNISGDTWKFSRINIFGNWQGFIYGLPEGYSYMEDENGITVYSDVLDDPGLNKQFALFAVNNENSATTTNNIVIEANTGNNNIIHASGGATIDTGSINIYNSLLNFINSNFTGDNWEFSMINVFGEWDGNLSFGQPDLWISEGHNPASSVRRGEYITYTFLYGNKGDLTATDVVIVDDFNEDLVVPQSVQGFEVNSGVVVWEIGDVPPHTQGSFSYTVYVGAGQRIADRIKNRVEISGREGDRNFLDNQTGSSLILLASSDSESNSANISNVVGSGGEQNNTYPSLKVSKTNTSDTTMYAGEKVDYRINITNTGDANLNDVLVLDVMTGENSDQEIHRELWDLGIVYAGEEVVIEYSVEIDDTISVDVYTNEVIVEGYDSSRSQFIHAIAGSQLSIVSGIRPERRDGANIDLGMELGREEYYPGDEVGGRIIITNNGQYQVKNIDIIQNLPQNLTNVDESGSIIKKWNIDWLNPGQIEVINFSFTISSNLSTSESGVLSVMVESEGMDTTRKEIVVSLEHIVVLGQSMAFEEEDKTDQYIYEIEDDQASDSGKRIVNQSTISESDQEADETSQSEDDGFMSISRPSAMKGGINVANASEFGSIDDANGVSFVNKPFFRSLIVWIIVILLLLLLTILGLDYYYSSNRKT